MIFEKRGRWCFQDKDGRLRKFDSEAEAKAAAAGLTIVTEEEGVALEDIPISKEIVVEEPFFELEEEPEDAEEEI
jgi:hypothetical protein